MYFNVGKNRSFHNSGFFDNSGFFFTLYSELYFTMETVPYNKRKFKYFDTEDGERSCEWYQWMKKEKFGREKLVRKRVDNDAPQRRIPSLQSLAQTECLHLLKRAGNHRDFSRLVSDNRKKTSNFMKLLVGMWRGLSGENPGDVLFHWGFYRRNMPLDFIEGVEELMKRQPPKRLSVHHRVRSDWCMYGDDAEYPIYY